jgi:glycosyltransferase involved in cell wall biosynthesis
MKVYFGGAIAGGRQNAAIYRVIVDHLESTGHDVLTKHVARADVLTWEQARTPQEVYERDMAWLRQCDAVVAEVTSPSLGVGYEIAEALHLGKPVLCIYRDGTALTKLLTGNTKPGIVVLAYASEAELLSAVDAFLERTPRAG